MSESDSLRIGCGAGFAGDRVTPAEELAAEPTLDYLIFECLAERTIALAQREKLDDPEAGYNPRLEERFEAVLEDCVANGITVITNMGAANPSAAGAAIADIAEKFGLDGLRIAVVTGSDVLDRFDALDSETFGGESLEAYREDAVSANAYVGADPIVEALDADADVVVTDRVADVSLFLAAMIHEFGWSFPESGSSDLIGQGIAAGHLAECAGQVTGGYFADPGYADVPDLATLGFPILEVSGDGTVIVTKLPDAGGRVTPETCTQQLLYEVHDPSRYLTPDGVADFSGVEFEEREQDRVAVRGATADPRPDTLKVSVGYEDSYAGVGEIFYGGPGARERAELAGEIVRERVEIRGLDISELRIDFIGATSLHGDVAPEAEPYEVGLRVTARCPSAETADALAREVQTLYTNGPAGGGGARMQTDRVVGIVSTLVDRAVVEPTVDLIEVKG